MRYFLVFISVGLFSLFAKPGLYGEQETPLAFRLIQLPPSQVNFAFDGFKTFWNLNEEDFKNFYLENSRIENVEVPKLPIDWKTEASMMIFWKSEDDIIRFPSLSHATVTPSSEEGKHPVLELEFILMTPCFGIITDASPSYLMTFPYKDLKYSKIKIKTNTSRQTGCIETQEASEKTSE